MSRDYKLYLKDMLNAIEKIDEYVRNLDKETLNNNNMILDAVIRNLEIIGEASKRIPESIKSVYTEIEWRKIGGLRDILIHEYFGIDIDIIWDILEYKLPELKRNLQSIIEQER